MGPGFDSLNLHTRAENGQNAQISLLKSLKRARTSLMADWGEVEQHMHTVILSP
jgi:hypothetical protein